MRFVKFQENGESIEIGVQEVVAYIKIKAGICYPVDNTIVIVFMIKCKREQTCVGHWLKFPTFQPIKPNTAPEETRDRKELQLTWV